VIHGEDLLGEFRFNYFEKSEISFKESFNNSLIINLKKMIDFIQNIEKNSFIRVVDFDKNEIFKFKIAGKTMTEGIVELVAKIYKISTELGIDIRFKSNIDDQDKGNINFLYNIMMNKSKKIDNKIDLIFDSNMKMNSAIANIEKNINSDLIIEYPKQKIDILNTVIDLSEYFTFHLEKIQKIITYNEELKISIIADKINSVYKDTFRK